MNRKLFLIAMLFPVAASATGVSFGYETGAGVFLFLIAIIIGLVLMYRVVARTRKDCFSQDEKTDLNSQKIVKNDDKNNSQ